MDKKIQDELRDKYYATFDLGKKSKQERDLLKNEMLYNLYKMPKQDKGPEVARTVNYQPYHTYQADLLTVPNDNGYRYILTVVDINTGKTEAEPLKSKKTEEVKDAFIAIFNRNILKKPVVMKTDAGSEFLGAVKKYFIDNKIVQKTAIAGRHRQVSIVEKRNGTIAKALFQRMTAEEILTNTKNTEWVEILPLVINAINNNVKPQTNKPKTDTVKVGRDKDILSIGTRVRVQLDFPINVVTGKKLETSNFRKTDIRFNPKLQTVTRIILKPDSPVIYMVDNQKNVGYTRNQLQVVPENELEPKGEVVIKKQDNKKYIPVKILGHKMENRKKYYLVQWYGFDKPSLTLASDFKADKPEMVKQYEASIKKKI